MAGTIKLEFVETVVAKETEDESATYSMERLFVTACDRNYFPGLWALLNSIYAYHEAAIPVWVYERNFRADELTELRKHPLDIQVFRVSELPYFSPGMWEAKQQVLAQCIGRAKTVCLIDVDIVLTSPIDDVFALALDGKIVAGSDAGELHYGPEFAAFSPALPGMSQPYLNSGIVCLDVVRHWDVVGLWAFAANYGAYSPHRGFPLHLPGHGDQGLLNAIIAMLHKVAELHVLPLGPWHETFVDGAVTITDEGAPPRLVVWNERFNTRQRLLHATNGKWWHHEGANAAAQFGDKLKCYQYFSRLVPRHKEE
jgi:hypothetical protein